MKREHLLRAMAPDLEILLQKSPMTAALRRLAEQADFYFTSIRQPRRALRACLQTTQVIASNDPWSEVEYQSLYMTDDLQDRLVLQEPATKDPTVGTMVLKAARLRGESGMVYCGTPEQLKSFAEKLPEYEERGIDLDEKRMLDCLKEAAESEGLYVIYLRLSPEHGGEEEEEEWD
jgi:hypothetical protein